VKFEDWTSMGSLLWICGKPGSGKSVLCSAIIKHAMSLRDAGLASLAYFYFDFRDKDKKQDTRNFVTSLLVQLSAYSSPCCKIISGIYSNHGKGTQRASDDALMDCLQQMLLVAAHQPIYLVVDALDECPDSFGMPSPREEVLDLLVGLIGLGLANLRICVTSRPEVDIKDVLWPLASDTVSLQDECGQIKDISDYVRNVVQSDRKMRRWRRDQKEMVLEQLSKKADGM
jgi:ABC-type dipeptide/oligopeptide/nickel transport system ATPase component